MRREQNLDCYPCSLLAAHAHARVQEFLMNSLNEFGVGLDGSEEVWLFHLNSVLRLLREQSRSLFSCYLSRNFSCVQRLSLRKTQTSGQSSESESSRRQNLSRSDLLHSHEFQETQKFSELCVGVAGCRVHQNQPFSHVFLKGADASPLWR